MYLNGVVCNAVQCSPVTHDTVPQFPAAKRGLQILAYASELPLCLQARRGNPFLLFLL